MVFALLFNTSPYILEDNTIGKVGKLYRCSILLVIRNNNMRWIIVNISIFNISISIFIFFFFMLIITSQAMSYGKVCPTCLQVKHKIYIESRRCVVKDISKRAGHGERSHCVSPRLRCHSIYIPIGLWLCKKFFIIFWFSIS